jgi:hypothetical protein
MRLPRPNGKAAALMLANVCCRYPEAGLFMIPPKNLLLPNLPHSRWDGGKGLRQWSLTNAP